MQLTTMEANLNAVRTERRHSNYGLETTGNPSDKNRIELSTILEPIHASQIKRIHANLVTDAVHCRNGELQGKSPLNLLSFQVNNESYNFLFSDADLHKLPELAAYVSRSIWRFRQDLKDGSVQQNQIDDARLLAFKLFDTDRVVRANAMEVYTHQSSSTPAYFIVDQLIAANYAGESI